MRVTYESGGLVWISDVLALNAFDIAFCAWMASLLNAPDDPSPGKPRNMGSAAGGYTLNLTGTDT